MSKSSVNERVIRAARVSYAEMAVAHEQLIKLSFPSPLKREELIDIERSWFDFIRACMEFIDRFRWLPKAIKEPWFFRVQKMHDYNVPNCDELLSYIKACRNEKTHGLQIELTLKEDASVSLITAVPPWEWPEGRPPNPEQISGTILNSGNVWLAPVLIEDHGKTKTIPVPTKHLDQSIMAQTPRSAARAAIPFYADLLKKAETLLK